MSNVAKGSVSGCAVCVGRFRLIGTNRCSVEEEY